MLDRLILKVTEFQPPTPKRFTPKGQKHAKHCQTATEGGGGHSLIEVGTDVRRVQNLGRAKFPQKT